MDRNKDRKNENEENEEKGNTKIYMFKKTNYTERQERESLR